MIDEAGVVRLLEPVNIKSATRVLVVVMDENSVLAANEESLLSANLSEQALAKDWLNEEEDEAWSHLQ